MGPVFYVYGRLRKIEMSEVRLFEDGTPEEDNITSFYSNPNFPVHISGLDSNLFYKCNGKRMKFGAGSEQDYQEFKEHLAKITGFDSTEQLLNTGGPAFFIELINFSNTEGTIGPIICNKLYHDFSDNYDVANDYFSKLEHKSKFWVHYQNWCKALYVAKQNGAILIA